MTHILAFIFPIFFGVGDTTTFQIPNNLPPHSTTQYQINPPNKVLRIILPQSTGNVHDTIFVTSQRQLDSAYTVGYVIGYNNGFPAGVAATRIDSGLVRLTDLKTGRVVNYKMILPP